ncbi:hypothetical protein LCGC14_0673780 [marine sediment metagenome]|uniref:ParB/Sulfiredoxin domain-containing protein n=1 Tax=marine sediment metagenome TaxID=412755 RepID=A0A0F9QQA7_9ZZZZ
MANQCTRLVDVERLFFADNVRTPECLQLPAMVESFKRHGFKLNHPLVVSEKEVDGNTVYHVLVGNRRGLGLVWLRENEPDEYRRILSTGKVPAIVHKGLTKEEEVDHRIDHSSDEDRVPLDDWSIFLAIRQLVQVGIDTQERIAVKLGLFKQRGKDKGKPNRSYVQVRVNLARLPMFVQDEYQKLFVDGKGSTAVRCTDIANLYKAYNKEYTEFPNSDGPDFMGAWTDAIAPPTERDATDDGMSAKDLTPAEAVKRSQGAQSKALKGALLVVTRQSDGNLADIDAEIVKGESALFTLRAIEALLGKEEFEGLVANAHGHVADVEPINDILVHEISEEVPV